MTKYFEITIDDFLNAYERMNNKHLSKNDKKKIESYGIKIPKTYKGLTKDELLLIKDVRKFQLEIIDLVECDKLRILI